MYLVTLRVWVFTLKVFVFTLTECLVTHFDLSYLPHHIEYDFMLRTMKQDMTKAVQFSNTFRYIDDLFSVNNENFGHYINAIYRRNWS